MKNIATDLVTARAATGNDPHHFWRQPAMSGYRVPVPPNTPAMITRAVGNARRIMDATFARFISLKPECSAKLKRHHRLVENPTRNISAAWPMNYNATWEFLNLFKVQRAIVNHVPISGSPDGSRYL